ncbi:hypothetical protein BHYA_0114g00020 [Botrytis hyacinthi]|uniref:Uncharacterized protein n=1 Tax=Botrytis hyacinthi TaxID=278943 RepID=A0A4Z1GN75_9HELO|nr:hypothetical protein BHYA_0114g00020 [Botrytis hyacinthi]
MTNSALCTPENKQSQQRNINKDTEMYVAMGYSGAGTGELGTVAVYVPRKKGFGEEREKQGAHEVEEGEEQGEEEEEEEGEEG